MSTTFDLQRFADDTLASDGSQFSWNGGGKFQADGEGAVGSKDNPAHLSTTGQDAVSNSDLYLNGDSDGYAFAINGIDGVELE